MEFKPKTQWCIAGSCGSGKSHLIKYMAYSTIFGALKRKERAPLIEIITMTPEDYDWADQRYVHTNYSDQLLARILARQKARKNSGQSLPCVLIFDDILGAVNFNSGPMTGLISRFRHYDLCVVYATQYIFKMPPILRECSNYAVLFRQSSKPGIKAAFESFGMRGFDNEKIFARFLEKNTGNYSFVLVNLKSPSQFMNDIYQSKRAPEKVPPFKINYS